MENMFETKQAV